MFRHLREDIRVARERDPAARSALEVLCCYPGVQVLVFYRLAHRLWQARLYFLARLIMTWARSLTGIDIHPGAKIGRRLFIDHGMGVVIGETAEIGDDVTMYQGVTLGGTGKERGKRHPTVGNHVLIASGAKVLGNITIGDDANIGGGAVVLRSVPAGATVVGVPARVISIYGQRVGRADLADELPARFAQTFEAMESRIQELEERVRQLEAELADLERGDDRDLGPQARRTCS